MIPVLKPPIHEDAVDDSWSVAVGIGEQTHTSLLSCLYLHGLGTVDCISSCERRDIDAFPEFGRPLPDDCAKWHLRRLTSLHRPLLLHRTDVKGGTQSAVHVKPGRPENEEAQAILQGSSVVVIVLGQRQLELL